MMSSRTSGDFGRCDPVDWPARRWHLFHGLSMFALWSKPTEPPVFITFTVCDLPVVARFDALLPGYVIRVSSGGFISPQI